MNSKRIEEDKLTIEKNIRSLNFISRIDVGKLLTGLKGETKFPDSSVTCLVSENDFVFTYTNFLIIYSEGKEIGKIPRNSINQIIIDDKSQITQQVTVGRVLALGVFSLAAPKTVKQMNFCLLIDWNDENGTRENTIFEFSGINSNIEANNVANTLKKYVKPKVERLTANEKKCPYCAEIIKQEAKVCKHCGRDLPEIEV